MFSVGDKVVYPMHGAGVIEVIENVEVLGEIRRYYVLRIPSGDMKVMVPVDNAEEVGLRNIMSEDSAEKVLRILKSPAENDNSNWSRRYRVNMDRLKSGDIYETAEVTRNLLHRDRIKGLSSVEKRMLDNARRILVSELILVTGKKEEQIMEVLDSCQSE